MQNIKRNLLRFLTALCVLAGAAALPQGAEASEIARAVFENVRNETPDLYVTKTVAGGAEGAEAPSDDRFTFTLKLDGKKAAEQEYQVFDRSGSEIFRYDSGESPEEKPGKLPFQTDRNGDFTLKDGQTAKFVYVGSGVSYEVTEHPLEGYSQTSPAGGVPAVGVVTDKGTAAEFVNRRTPGGGEEGKTTRLEIQKAISFPSGYEAPKSPDFSFLIKIGGKPYAGEPYTVSDAATGKTLREGSTDAKGCFLLKGGETAVFSEVPTNRDYEVVEQNKEGWRTVGEGTLSGATKSPLMLLTYTNVSASFAVTKKLEDDSKPDKDFTFLLTDGSRRVWAGASYLLYDTYGKQLPAVKEDGTPLLDSQGEPVFLSGVTDANGQFTLKPGQAAVFTGVAPGTVYNVSEIGDPAYTQIVPNTAEGYKDKVVSDAVEVLPFVNRPAPGALSVTKRLNNLDGEAPLEKQEFRFVLMKEDGTPAADAVYSVAVGASEKTYKTDENGEFTLKANETARFTRLPDGKYQVKEIQLSPGYTAEKTVLDAELSERNRSAALTFVNSYSKRTFDLYLIKTDAGSKERALPGAEFMLYRDELGKNPVQEVPYVTGSDGAIHIEGLKNGVYFLKETKAPEGYQLLTKPIRIEVAWKSKTGADGTQNGYVMEASVDEKKVTAGQKDAQIYIVQKGTGTDDKNEVHIKIYNSRNFSLPLTGGSGTAAAAVVSLLGASAVLILLGYRNRKRRINR